MKIIRLTLVDDFEYYVLFFKNKNAVTAYLKRTDEKFIQDTIEFKDDNKVLYSVRAVGERARVVGLYSNLEEAKKKSQKVGNSKAGVYSDVRSYKIFSSYKPATILNVKGRFISNYSMSASS